MDRVKPPPSNFNSRWDEGIENITVSLWGFQNAQEEADTITAFYRSTWGALEEPTSINSDEAWGTAQDAMEGKLLPNCLEPTKLTFGIEGISRATTHQLVRSRVGVGFGQQGGRDNNWSNFNFRAPPTFDSGTKEWVQAALVDLRAVYEELLRKGVPYQDARYILPIGLETALVGTYTLLALKGTLARRLCNRMAWEVNYVARLMHDHVVQALPWVGRNLRSRCESGICQSVSPMFPPACWSPRLGSLADDNPTLTKMTNKYDWSHRRNGNWILWTHRDKERATEELEDPDIVMSLAGEMRVLARREEDGLWRRANG